MNKLNRILLGLLVLQVGVLGVAKLLGGDHRSASKTRKLFGELKTDDVQSIKIGDQNKSLTLEKRGDGWVLAGSGYPAKKSKVDELLGKLPGLTVTDPVVTKKAAHRALEVAADKFQRQITLELAKGTPNEFSFYLGSSPGIKKVHFRFANEDQVYVVSDLSTWDLGVNATDWVDAEYLKLERDKIVALTLNNKQGQIALSKVDGTWQLQGMPAADKLKQPEVDSLLSAASAVNLQEPVGQQLEPRFGLDQPLATLTVVTETSAAPKTDATSGADAGAPAAPLRKTYELKIGAKDGDRYFAKSDQSTFVVKLATWTADTLVKKKPADLIESPETAKKEAPQKGPAAKGPAAKGPAKVTVQN